MRFTDEKQQHQRGSTIEWQITGEDSAGGFQLQIIPDFRIAAMSATSTRHVCCSGEPGKLQSYTYNFYDDTTSFDVYKSPTELNLPVGSTIYIKDLTTLKQDRPKTALDLIAEAPAHQNAIDTVEIEIYQEQRPEQLIFNVKVSIGQEKGSHSL
ncbi:uncharacterized protein A1O5_08403 [Cladophialophora psammophila CBS 110553]|uniref:Uncharacterized protein n=1 Tax=Cladophialophora psammophila CBS 110553 TaxID=1182543 RepID=W9XDV3_9EURO|nr:uncharacterized protein A1O5_08403 [Cladophialophora psammophila CBS 110553]EXJ68609.1 hypothetical protein A1O5_08403 [Cladophialophora psammophila CBS 110553]